MNEKFISDSTYLVNRPRLVCMTRREVRVLERNFAAADDVEETLAVLLVGVVFWVVAPDLRFVVSRVALDALAAVLTHPFGKPCPNHLRVFPNLRPISEVVLLCVDERHLLGAGDALVAQSVVHLGGHGSI